MCVCKNVCVSECVCAAFLPSLKAWKHNYALTQRHRPAFHMTHRTLVFGHKSTAVGVEVALHNVEVCLKPAASPATALSCSKVFSSSWFTDCKAFCVCMWLWWWRTMDRTAAAHLCSLCFTGSLEKALITRKGFQILPTFHNWLHLLPPPQLTRYIWQHQLLTTNEQKGWFHLKIYKTNKFTKKYLHRLSRNNLNTRKNCSPVAVQHLCWHLPLSLSQKYEPLLVYICVQAHGSDKLIFES